LWWLGGGGGAESADSFLHTHYQIPNSKVQQST